ncbi:MAG: alpha/beta hydrolase [Myxococcales bacterium]
MSFWRSLRALLAFWFWSLRGGLRTVIFMLRLPGDAAWALKSAQAVNRRGIQHESRLELVGPSLYRLKEADRRTANADRSSVHEQDDGRTRPPIVIYFTGTGETPEAVLLGFQRMRREIPALAEATEYVVAPPNNKGAYYSGDQFGARMWEVVEPLVKHYPGPFVFVGFSRGAVVSLDVATRVAEEHAKVAGALALSPPLLVPERLPLPVRTIAGFEVVVEGLREAGAELPRWLAEHVELSVYQSQLLLTGMVLKNLGVVAPEELDMAVSDMRSRGTFDSALAASREFRLLTEARPREGELFTEQLARSFAESRSLYAELLWGSADDWVDGKLCEARMQQLLPQYPQARERFRMTIIPAQGHALFRASGADPQPTLQAFRRVAEQVTKLAAERESEARQKAQQSAIQRLRSTEEMP